MTLIIVSLFPSVVVRAQTAPLTVTSAAPDPSGQTVTVQGSGFGTRPFVTLDLVPLTVQFSVDSQIVAVVPVNQMPPGSYLLTVSRGAAAGDTGSVPLVLGGAAANPAARPADATPGSAPPNAPATDAAIPSGADQAAKIGDRAITVAEIDREWQRTDSGSYLALARELYDNRRRAADLLMANELLAREAAARGLSVDALLAEDIPKRVVPLPDSAVLALYQSLGDRTRGATLEQMRPALRAWLERNTQRELARMNYVEELMKVSTRAEVVLSPPRVQPEIEASDPSAGPAGAPIQIVAFGDLHSADYARFAQAFSRVRDTYGERIRLVFKPLVTLGAESAAMAEAAACANAQGKFWPYHDRVLGESGTFDADRLKKIASDAGIDRRTFDTCFDRGTFASSVRKSAQQAEQYAIPGTAAFLVNGWLAPAPPAFLPPFEFFTRVIEEELLRQTRAARAR